MTPQITEQVRDIIDAVRETELCEDWLDNWSLCVAYEKACDPETIFSAASTRLMLDALFEGLREIYGADLYAEDMDGRQLHCPMRWLFFQVCDATRALDEAAGVAWWQRAYNEAAAAREVRDAKERAAGLGLAA